MHAPYLPILCTYVTYMAKLGVRRTTPDQIKKKKKKDVVEEVAVPVPDRDQPSSALLFESRCINPERPISQIWPIFEPGVDYGSKKWHLLEEFSLNCW